MTSNPLPPIWRAYQTISNCLKANNKSAKVVPLADDTELVVSEPLADSRLSIQQGHAQLNDLFVLALWATFERCIRDYLQVKGDKLKTVSPATLAEPLYEHFGSDAIWVKYRAVSLRS